MADEPIGQEACEHCGDEYGVWCVNPYINDIWNTEQYEWICNDCYDSLLGDI